MPLPATNSRTGILSGGAVLGAAAVGFLLVVGLPPSADPDGSPAPDPVPSAAEAIALRFPPPSSQEAAAPRASVVAPPPVISPLLLARPDDTTGEITPQARPYADHSGAALLGAAGSASVPPRTAARPGRTGRPANLLNEAQIASIKARLKLAAEQEPYWSPVAAALRELAWRHAHERPGSKAEPSLDRDGVQRLQLAAAPLLMRLREDQKRELRLLAHIIGLERLVSQF
jgi:hypothetical protein